MFTRRHLFVFLAAAVAGRRIALVPPKRPMTIAQLIVDVMNNTRELQRSARRLHRQFDQVHVHLDRAMLEALHGKERILRLENL